MTVIGYLSAGFALAAVLALVGLCVLSASESVTWGRLSGSWSLWRSKRKRAKEQRRARRLPVARLRDRTDVVRLADCVKWRSVK